MFSWFWKQPSDSTSARKTASTNLRMAKREAAESEAPPKRKFESTGKIKLTSQDQKFLKALKIAIDEEKS